MSSFDIMPKQRFVPIPIYLRNRKIHLIRKKILARKFGYLFYRKSISPVIPSVAWKYYLSNILRKYFDKWSSFYYEERILWRQQIRADVHYNLSLKKNCFAKWKLAIIHHKEVKLRNHLAKLFFIKRQKVKCFYKLKYSKLLRVFTDKQNNLFIDYIALLFINFNTLKIFRVYVKQKIIFLILNYNKRKLLMRCFSRMVQFCDSQKQKSERNKILKRYLKSKYDPEYLRSFLDLWKQYVSHKKNKNLIIIKVDNRYHKKLLRHYFVLLVKYKHSKQEKRYLQIVADNHFEAQLKLTYYKRWRKFYKMQVLKSYNLSVAINHYNHSLSRRCLKRMYEHYIELLDLHHKLDIADNFRKRKLKTVYFCKLKQYVVNKQRKLRMLENSDKYWMNKLKQRMFTKLNQYALVKRTRRNQNNDIVSKCCANASTRIKIFYFKQWKTFLCNQRLYKIKLNLADSKCNINLKVRYFRKWQQATKMIKAEYIKNNHLIKKRSFEMWKGFCVDIKMFKERLIISEELYQNYLKYKGLRIILYNGLEKKRERELYALRNWNRLFCIVSKYFTIWKNKANFGSLKKELPGDNLRKSEFVWKSQLYGEPRIPDYLKSHL